tara:strand:+ start:119 stop:265 length:147 start_codon:yes stop_codon:yes gene_type:complete
MSESVRIVGQFIAVCSALNVIRLMQMVTLPETDGLTGENRAWLDDFAA